MRQHPHVYEANATLLLKRLARKHGRKLSLASVPEQDWALLPERGFDALWLMGVWRRSPGSRQQALALPGLVAAYDQALPGWKPQDIAGSPYAIADYQLDPGLGKPDELARLHQTLGRLGVSLLLDFVPNHLAVDHRWTREHPDWFVAGEEAQLAEHADWFFRTPDDQLLAHGRDPYFPPWSDTAQLDWWQPELRQAMGEQLLRIAEQCDGVRCDMAMLILNQVFERVWGSQLAGATAPEQEPWSQLIETVRARHPSFLFLAEAYWDLEPRLLSLGFDYAYDKPLYDLLRYADAEALTRHLDERGVLLEHGAHFVENHDEERAAAAFEAERARAASCVVATLPGLRLFHDGQLEGRQRRLPVQLVAEPRESPDPETALFYSRLLRAVDHPAFHEGRWERLQVEPAEQWNATHRSLVAWSWQRQDALRLVLVNFSASEAHGRLRLVWPRKERVLLHELLSDSGEDRLREDLDREGLELTLDGWQCRVFDVA